ncbi:hypothetical protein [Streptomyces monashensis]|uniref:hypothetical protein n=1 Tax=Streptomyces monashensis TaxID=1678012 RepID=UPI0011605DC6|nr:hypothetical protein [Streptomyces monashensis]
MALTPDPILRVCLGRPADDTEEKPSASRAVSPRHTWRTRPALVAARLSWRWPLTAAASGHEQSPRPERNSGRGLCRTA